MPNFNGDLAHPPLNLLGVSICILIFGVDAIMYPCTKLAIGWSYVLILQKKYACAKGTNSRR